MLQFFRHTVDSHSPFLYFYLPNPSSFLHCLFTLFALCLFPPRPHTPRDLSPPLFPLVSIADPPAFPCLPADDYDFSSSSTGDSPFPINTLLHCASHLSLESPLLLLSAVDADARIHRHVYSCCDFFRIPSHLLVLILLLPCIFLVIPLPPICSPFSVTFPFLSLRRWLSQLHSLPSPYQFPPFLFPPVQHYGGHLPFLPLLTISGLPIAPLPPSPTPSPAHTLPPVTGLLLSLQRIFLIVPYFLIFPAIVPLIILSFLAISCTAFTYVLQPSLLYFVYSLPSRPSISVYSPTFSARPSLPCIPCSPPPTLSLSLLFHLLLPPAGRPATSRLLTPLSQSLLLLPPHVSLPVLPL
ncbi:hypothetical protein HNY73_006065 [Argiope bruennichi]|uniref:Uncharacterized protein n=1 Tax=Argiope bruennichi TaxID=94029 RepID=A0A8T0FIR1_ARGBR|nr:hypothetical protein HNY73_006065 [Argiope bruennichi]